MPYRSLPVGSKSLTDRAQHSPNPRPRRGRTPGDQAAAPRPPDPVSITRGLNRHSRHSRPVGAQTRSRCLSVFHRSARATAASCASELPPRTEAVWDRATRTATCLDRVDSAEADGEAPPAPAERSLPRGESGGSAGRQYEPIPNSQGMERFLPRVAWAGAMEPRVPTRGGRRVAVRPSAVVDAGGAAAARRLLIGPRGIPRSARRV